MTKLFTRVAAIALATSAGALAQDALVLQDFDAAGDLAGAYKTNGTQAELVTDGAGRALQVVSGTSNPYPNVLINPPEGRWDLAKFKQVELDVENLSKHSMRIAMRVDNAGATGRKNSNGGGITLDPGEKGTIVVPMHRDVSKGLAEKLEGMHHTPWGPRGDIGGPIDPSKIVQVNIFLNKPDHAYTFRIDNLRATGTYDPAADRVPEPFFPFIDTYGQYIHDDWPGKVKTDADLVADRETEAKSIHDAPRPADWNAYGGWANGPQLPSTKHFTVSKHAGKWQLVDPEGRLFFSLGMDVVKPGSTTPIDKRDNWFKDPPWEQPAFKQYLAAGEKRVARGDYKDTTPRIYDFFAANAQRKYGDKWQAEWMQLTPKRLMNWGFNTLGNWTDPELFQTTSIPYTHWIFNDGPKLPWRQAVRNRIPDPWNPALQDVLMRRGRTMTKGTTDDPKCIGYFVDNEISWGTEESIGETALMGDGESHAKVQLVKDLKGKYESIDKLNAVWKTSYASWDALLGTKMTVKELPKGKAVDEDFRAFGEATAHKYFSTVKKVVNTLAPGKLYLGCRFAEYNPMVVRVAADYCDVLSFNLYRETVAAWAPPGGVDKPVIIGEFHFGATDRGVFGDGLKGAASTPDRARMFERYVSGAAANPYLVGAHWFQLTDEPTTGRVQDGENHGVGFLTITDRPYQEMIDASRAVAKSLYTLRAGKPVASN